MATPTGLAALQVNAVKTNTSAPAMGYVNRYDAAAGALVVTLPALSGQNVGARTMVQKYALDPSSNTVTFNRAGSDQFDDASTSVVLHSPGESRTLQVASISGVKRWKVMEAMGLSGSAGTVAAADITDATTIGRTVLTSANAAAVRAAIGVTGTAFSTADYAPGSGGDGRPQVAGAVAAAVAAMTATGKDQVVLIHAPLTFTTGVTKAALGTTADAANTSHSNIGVPIPCNLSKILHIVYAAGATITLSSSCNNVFYTDKLADYDVFQNVYFYNASTDGGTSMADEAHALVGNSLSAYPKVPLRYMSFQNIKFFGYTKFRNFHWDATGATGGGQAGIVFRGEHNGPLEATQTFSKDIYLEYGDQEGGGGVFTVASAGSIRYHPGGCNHYYDNIVVDRYRVVMPSVPTSYTNHTHTGIYICSVGFGDRCYIGPGYVENIGDGAIEVGGMQQIDIVAPRSKNPWFYGIYLRQFHAPIDVDTQKINITGMRCEVTSAHTATANSWIAPIGIYADDHAVTLTSAGTSGTFKLIVGGTTTAAINWNATASQIATALVTAGFTGTTASGGPINTTPVTVRIVGPSANEAVATDISLLGGGDVTVELSPANASFGTITIEDPVFTVDGLLQSKYAHPVGFFIDGMDQPVKRVNIIRPKISLSNYTYDLAGDDTLSMVYAASAYPGWGHVVIRDWELLLDGTCNFAASTGTGYFFEVLAAGNSRVEIDGMVSDRSAASFADAWMLGAGWTGGDDVRCQARRLNPRGLAGSGNSGGVRLNSSGIVNQFDIFDSDFSQGTNSNSVALNLSGAGGNAGNARASHNLYPTAVAGGTITPSGSPFTWQNTKAMTAVVEVSAGTVSQIQRGDRGGTYTTSAFTSGTFTVDAGAYLKVTYSSAPTMTYTLLS